ncbi:YfbK domain-containing protein [Novipirellula artificiosorum]|uniref:von Willebrand factor n=1 Tax=Novipirellula artificiosorum TaxID=2528016 RepID=A0A5C6E0R9_9BACT|nr:von Willebrand factor type A domain-containing protein [Novipirellula artificiosorum]TWU42450.1 von Willebrand factor [Novipirellula artificiosorum]
MSESIWNDPRITAYVLGELDEAERTSFEQEVESTPALADAIAEARELTGKLGTLYAAESTPPLDTDRRQQILAPKNAAATVSADSGLWYSPTFLKWATAVCAAFVLLGLCIPVIIKSWTPVEMARESSSTAGPLRQDVEDDLMANGDSVPLSELALSDEGLGEDAESLFAVAPGTSKPESGIEYSGPIASEESKRETGLVLNKTLQTSRPESSSKGKTVLRQEEIANAAEKSLSLSAQSTRGLSAAAAPAPNVEFEFADSYGSGAANVTLGFDGTAGLPSTSAPMLSKPPFIRQAGQPIQATESSDRSIKAERLRMSMVDDSAWDPFAAPFDEGRGPGIAGDRFDPIVENPFKRVSEHPLSTFSVDVDTASYSKVRDFLMRANALPRPDAVRIEEMVNYFDYAYEPPRSDAPHPFAARTVVTECPWNEGHRLARIALKGQVVEQSERPKCNLVFLLDTSGSMNAPNKLPLVVQGMKMLVKQLNETDRVAIVVYAGSAGLVLDSTKVKNGSKIRKSLTQLSAGGSTNGGQGIALAYQTARDHFIDDGVNRVILCTDGDFNVGTTGTDQLVRMVEKESKAGVFLSVLGFGMGNHNDAMLEQISGKGNGNYAFIDNEKEARKVLVEQTNGTLMTIAKDVKIQVEFNVSKVDSYRLIGYENRMLAKEDFNDDTKDAGEIGAGHSVTALYEIVPAGAENDSAAPKVDELKYQTEREPTEAAESGETMTVKLRYKQPDADESTKVDFLVFDEAMPFAEADADTRFATAVAGFGMQLRRSEYRGNWTLSDVVRVANQAKGDDRFELRAEFVELARKASELMGQE